MLGRCDCFPSLFYWCRQIQNLSFSHVSRDQLPCLKITPIHKMLSKREIYIQPQAIPFSSSIEWIQYCEGVLKIIAKSNCRIFRLHKRELVVNTQLIIFASFFDFSTYPIIFASSILVLFQFMRIPFQRHVFEPEVTRFLQPIHIGNKKDADYPLRSRMFWR